MKTKFMKIPPLIAAVLFATSCSKDDNGDTIADAVVNDQQPAVEQPTAGKVTIPFSIKVATGNSLSKITFDGTDGTSEHNVDFDDASDLGKTLTVKAVNASTYSDVEGELTLKKFGAAYIFDGSIDADPENEADLKAGKIDLVGSFEGGETGAAFSGYEESTESLAKLMQSFKHTFTANFNYTSDDIKLLDNVAYFCFTVSADQKMFDLKINGADKTIENFDANRQVWIAVPAGITVAGNMVKSMTTAAGKVYKADRSNVVDLGPDFSVLWKTTNETGGTGAISYNQGDVATSAYKDEKYYNWSNACDFGTVGNLKNGCRLPTQAELETLAGLAKSDLTAHNSMQCKEFGNNYGSVFFSAAGDFGGAYAGDRGYYWSGETSGSDVYLLSFTSGSVYVVKQGGNHGYSVRLVRSLN